MRKRAPWLDYLTRHIGLKEIPGPRHQALIVQWGRDAGISWWNNDEDAWCAVAVNGALVNSGYPSTKSALARSFVTYGTKLSKPVPGAIVVFPRGKDPLYGHVGIVESVGDDGTVTVVNGNVSNRVKRSTFRIASILPDGVRWPPGAALPDGTDRVDGSQWGRRLLREGSRGTDVRALQDDLNALGYGLDVDGIYGGRTADAVRRFQLRRSMEGTGRADASTLAALSAAVAARESRKQGRDAGERAAKPMVGAGAVVAGGVAAAASAPAAVGEGVVVLGIALCVLAVCVIGAVVLWRVGLSRAEGQAQEDKL